MLDKPILMIYLEDAPLCDKVAATGLSKAFNESLILLMGNKACVCIAQTHQFKNVCDFIDECRSSYSWVASFGFYVIAKVANRLPYPLCTILAILQGRWLASQIDYYSPEFKIPKIRILAPIGTDFLTIVRAKSFANSLNASLEPYLVDDLETHPANKGKKYIGKFLNEVLSSAPCVYAITDGLKSLIYQRYGVKPRSLPLVSIPKEKLSPGAVSIDKHKYFAFFCGSINHLYKDGLRILIEIVGELRKVYQKDLLIRLSSSRQQACSQLGSIPHWVITGSIPSSAIMRQEIMQSTFCYLPYSFSSETRDMTTSSFPSKLLDYLLDAKAIVVHASNWSTPYRLFADSGLPFITSNEFELKSCIIELLDKMVDLNSDYRKLLDSRFSAESFLEALGV